MEHLGTLFGMGKAIFAPLQSLKKNEDILDKNIEELSCLERDVQADLERGKLQYGKMPKREVELWLKNVQNIKDRVHDIKQKLEEVSWTHFQLHRNLAKEVEEKIKEAVELKEKGRFQEGLLVDLLVGSIETFPPIKIVGETTALKNLQKIEECLMDDEVGKIGVCGMGGVGKTTIMTNIHNNIKTAGTFDRVIWVTVSKESNLKKLQDDVSKELCLRLSNTEDALRRSAEIFRALNLIGKFLLILDDMWSTFPLEEVGIPEPNEENKCKIVWTTRSKEVCRGMGSQRTIEVDGLTKDESWTLFKEKLGANFVLSREIEPIAKAVVEECDGLPLGIITVGAAMRGVDDIRIWRNALEDLKNSRPSTSLDVFSCLRFSFDHLKTQKHRDCFLYCALYPEDYQIVCDSLIEMWMADGFFDEIEDREKGFDKGYTIIHDLKDACMLENARHVGRSCVKMHDLLRDLAIAITRKSRQFVVKVRSDVGKFPRDENLMDDVIRVSLMHSHIEMLSCQSKCPKLSTLLLEDSSWDNIDNLFFEHMQNLRVLNLTNTYIRRLPQSLSNLVNLPQSLSNLVNLHALLLRDCEILEEVPSLVQLRELRVLDLTRTQITYLPDGMDSLTNLRCLRLSFTELKRVPVGAISIFSHLEELSIACNGSAWRSNEDREGSRVGAEDIVGLKHLKKLIVEFKDLSAFSSYVGSGHWRGLKCYLLAVAHEFLYEEVEESQYNFYCRERQVHVSGKLQQAHNMNSIAFPGSNLTKLVISDLHNLSTIYMEEPTQGDTLAKLKHISISNCPKLKYVVSVGWFQTLQNLEEIIVDGCQAMEEMVVDTGLHKEEPTQGETLANLKHISISNCPKLKYVLSVGWFQTLQNLEEIIVDGCQAMEEMVVDTGLHKEEPTQGDTLANLKYICILDCPKLKYVLSVGWFQTLQNLEEIIVDGCQAMEELVVDTGLHKEEPTQGDTLANLKKIHIKQCPKLKYVLSVGWFQTLKNLKEIIVDGCQAMEEMVVDTGLHKEEPTQGDTLANLKKIHIKQCPKLKYVLSVGWFQTLKNLEEIIVDGCQAMEEMVVDTGLHKEEPTQGDTLAKLKHIRISNCPKLKYVLSVGWFQTLQNLEVISVEYCQALEEMVVDTGLHKEEPTQRDTLANLKHIRISNCPKLKYVLSVGWFQTLQNLEVISVKYCQALEEMVVDMGDIGEANNNIPITLPRLKILTLSDLPKLKSICKRTLICSSLEYIKVESCPMLKTLPFSINSLPSSLKQIKGSGRWWDSLEWDNANTKMHLQPFFLRSPECVSELEEDQERQGTKRKADSYLLDLNWPPLSLVQQHGESEPRELSPRNWQLWKRHE